MFETVPSAEVTTIVTTFTPVLNVIAEEAAPLVTADPLTVIVDVELTTVGVNVIVDELQVSV